MKYGVMGQATMEQVRHCDGVYGYSTDKWNKTAMAGQVE